MVDIDEAVLDEAAHEGESMILEDLFDIIERYHDDEPGVPREAITAYVSELDAADDLRIAADEVLERIDDRITESDTWAGRDHFYELGGDRLSQYPGRWHDRLGGSTDVAAYVRFLQEDVPEFVDDLRTGGAGHGIPEDTLIKIVEVVGQVDRGTAVDALEDARADDEIVEDVDQHPQAGVTLEDQGVDEE